MEEFENPKNMIQLIGKKMYIQGYKAPDVLPPLDKSYEYLINNVLNTMLNPEKFIELVYSIYMDRLSVSGGHSVPSLYEIVDLIDEENLNIIKEFYTQLGYNEDEIDIIEGNYIQDITGHLEQWVMRVLQEKGLAFRDTTYYNFYEERTLLVKQYAPQNILLIEFLM